MSELFDHTFIEDSVDEVFEVLMDDANYLANPSEEKVRYAPDVNLLELLAWNVVVAFSVNIAASYFYDYVIHRKHQKMVKERQKLERDIKRLQAELALSREQLAGKEECIQILKDTNDFLKSLNASKIIINSVHLDSTNSEDLLKHWGWPSSHAKSRAKQMVNKLTAVLRKKK